MIAKQAKILYVEDDEALSFVTKDHLQLQGYEVDHIALGDKAIDAMNKKKYDICLLDVMLPGMSGFEIAKHIRQINPAIPILFLTAKSLKEDRLKGFDVGGDDYITKPYSIEELVMKINVFLKRRYINQENELKGEIKLGLFTFNPNEMTLTGLEKTRQLTSKEADILKLFSTKQNELINRADILLQVWGEDDYFLGRSLDVFISKLRKYLSADERINIQNVHGVGFKMNVKSD